MQADDAHVQVLAELQQCLVAGNDGLRPAGNRAFQDAIIGLVADDIQPPPRPDQDTQSRQEHGDMREFLRIACKLACEDAEQLVENGLGDDELILLLHDAPERGFAAATRKHQSRYQDIGVEDDLQALR